MERPKHLIINRGIKLPVGYRFRPTDEELIVYYLKRKMHALPLPVSVIPDFDVFQTEPYCLPGDAREKRYFFSIRKESRFSKAGKRVAGSGYWKSTGKEWPIMAAGSSRIVGMRKRFIFCEAKVSHNAKTRWVMHELRLLDSETTTRSRQVSEDKEDWAVYRVFQKSRPQKRSSIVQLSKTKNFKMMEEIKASFIDFKEESCNDDDDGGPPQPSSPSCCSEDTVNELDQEESSSVLP